MLVLHVPLQVELFELRESAEAEEADDLPPEVVAQVPFCPNALEGPAIVDSVRYRLRSNYQVDYTSSESSHSIESERILSLITCAGVSATPSAAACPTVSSVTWSAASAIHVTVSSSPAL